ncbi:hypothetical protein J6590_052888 [Homalodisca vitripennis]|nr:hypothetical protein J6590_052888 [Homalodisca vitripennis]
MRGSLWNLNTATRRRGSYLGLKRTIFSPCSFVWAVHGETYFVNVSGSVGSKDLLFNVSCVQETEEVRLAQLQLNRRKLHQRHTHKRLLAPPFRVRLYQVTPTRLVPLASVPVSMVQRSAWASVDITAALKELLLDPKVSRRILAVRFESPSGKQIPPSHFLRGVPDTPHAFLVVFAEDSEENMVSEDGSQPAPKPPMHTHAMVQKLRQGPHAALFLGEDQSNDLQVIPLLDEARKAHMFIRNNTQRVNTLQTLPTYGENVEENKFTTSALIRKMRSIMDNQLPDDDDNALDNQVGKTLPTSVMGSKIGPVQHIESNKRKFKKGKKSKRKKGKKTGMKASSSFIEAWQSENQPPFKWPAWFWCNYFLVSGRIKVFYGKRAK